MTTEEKLWWAMCLRAHQYRYSYGRQANRTLKDLELPDEMPAWAKGLTLPDLDSVKKPLIAEPVILPDPSAWRAFRYDELFDFAHGERVTKEQLEPGDTPFLRSTESNNGLVFMADLLAAHPGGVITVSYNGSVGEAFYQPRPFFASDDVFVLTPKTPLSALAALFVCAIIRAEKFRFNYGRKWNMERMTQSVMRLPVDGQNRPDWNSMGRYMASLSFSAVAETGRDSC
jgi:hypothetical protein